MHETLPRPSPRPADRAHRCVRQWQAHVDIATGVDDRDAGDVEIDRRLGTLTTLDGLVRDARHLTDADRQELLGEISADRSGLTALKAKIDADTDLTTLRNDLRTIVTGYRVYVLLEPKVRL